MVRFSRRCFFGQKLPYILRDPHRGLNGSRITLRRETNMNDYASAAGARRSLCLVPVGGAILSLGLGTSLGVGCAIRLVEVKGCTLGLVEMWGASMGGRRTDRTWPARKADCANRTMVSLFSYRLLTLLAHSYAKRWPPPLPHGAHLPAPYLPKRHTH